MGLRAARGKHRPSTAVQIKLRKVLGFGDERTCKMMVNIKHALLINGRKMLMFTCLSHWFRKVVASILGAAANLNSWHQGLCPFSRPQAPEMAEGWKSRFFLGSLGRPSHLP